MLLCVREAKDRPLMALHAWSIKIIMLLVDRT